MLERLRVTRARLAADEDAVLLEAVLNTQTASDPLSEDERVVYDADEYLGNIMMDGHFLTLYNKGPERAQEIRASLERLGATRERELFERAVMLWGKHDFASPLSASEEVLAAFEPLDEQFLAWMTEDGNLEQRTKGYVRAHQDAFLVLE
jgi:hypothetical protein